MFQLVNLDLNDSSLVLEFKADNDNFNDVTLSFRVRDNKRWVLIERNQEYLIPVESHNNIFRVNVNLYDVFKNFDIAGKRSVIDIHVKIGKRYEKILLREDMINYINSYGVQSFNSIFNLKYYVINRQILAIQLLAKDIRARLDDVKVMNDGNLKLTIQSALNKSKVDIPHKRLMIKQRTIRNSPQTYINQAIINYNLDGYYIHPNEIIENFHFSEQDIFDLFLEYREENYSMEVPINNGDNEFTVRKWYEGKNNKLDLLKGKTGNLSIRSVKEKFEISLQKVQFVDNTIRLELDTVSMKQMQNAKIQIRGYLDGLNDHDTTIFFEKPLMDLDINNSISFHLNSIFGELAASNYPRMYKFFIEDSQNLISLNYNGIDLEETLALNNKAYKVRFDKTLLLEVKTINTNPIPIAIMGSCFSRAAFNSTADYFNPNYKDYFKISYSYFWPSMISTVSEPLEYDKSWFSDYDQNKIEEIEWEFLKNWDSALNASGAEYLLLDFFVDAMHGVVKVGKDKYIARNLYTRKTEHYHSDVLINSESFDSYHPDFFNEWKKGFDKFISKVKNSIPEEKIILNMSLLTDKYYDESGGISNFFDAKHITRSQFLHVNNIWTKMNNYFLTQLPNAQVIDMTKFNYISRYDAPKDLAPCGPHHFESDYYKAIVNELYKVIGLSSRLK